ncbi:(S)-2,3-di-O-geranylgeranylglyceryl phosphate synthase [mine drainage metagenome]|uniref:(S)-2,3-di-O-geranylgeranylglyceryl phosphate synthase n=1 Tax=mine drainage metagenome TaxID=410659 RepID=T1DFS9_9ZZZZ
MVLMAELLLFSYEYALKRSGLPGNIVVSALVGLIFIFGGIAVDHFSRMIILFFLAFFSNISRELIKDVEDMEGDLDRLTFPKRYGKTAALNLSSAFIIIAVSLSFVPYILRLFSIYYLIAVSFCDSAFLITVYIQFSSVKKAQRFSKLSMILGLISFAIGGLT